MEISFCDRCEASIPRSEVERGVAARRDGRLLCAPCRKAAFRRAAARAALLPLSLVLAVAAGAAIAVAVLLPRVRDLEGSLESLREDVRAATAGDPALGEELRGIQEIARAQTEAVADLREKIRADLAEVARSVLAVAGQVRDLSGEVRTLKAWAAEEPVPELPGPAPPEAAAAPDLDLWLPLADDSDPGVRLSALRELAKTDDPRVRAKAIELLSDSDWTVRAEAASVVGGFGEPGAVGALTDLLSDPNPLVRSVAHEAVTKIAGPVPGYAATDPEEIREKAVKAFIEGLR